MQREELQEIAINKLLTNSKGLLHLSPRSGKTFIALQALRRLQGTILISVPTQVIIDNWKQECEKWDFPVERLNFCCHASLHKQEHYDIICIDEIHSSISDIRIAGIKQIKSERIIGLSGSLTSKAKEVLLQELGLPVLFEYTINQAVAHNVIADYRIYIHEVPLLAEEQPHYDRLTAKVEWCKNNCSAKQLMFASLSRARFLYNLKSKNDYAKKITENFDRYILFAQLNTVINSLCNHVVHSGSGNNNDTANMELFKEGSINQLGLCKLGAEGITFPNLDTAVIVAINSSEVNMVQRCLRTMNNDEENKIANVHIIVSKDTQESKVWLLNSLKQFDKNKIILVK